MSGKDTISVEVAYALPERQVLLAIEVPAGTTALEAARLSGIAEQFEDLTLDESSHLGVFGQVVAATQVLQAGDRVEIYRPLIADPKEVRKARAARAKERRADNKSN
jgi:putative ubiquitin-RnfH superfamily antitoxin RatB of RatAB toxin-antitoxin module